MKTAITVSLLLLVPLVSLARAGEHPGGFWPEFHGPGRTNISSENGLLRSWPPGGPKVAWTFAGCGKGYASVSIAEGRIFTSGDFGRVGDGRAGGASGGDGVGGGTDDETTGGVEMVIALDLDGKLIWRSPNGKSWTGAAPGARAIPTWSGGLVYHANPTGRIAAFAAADGREVWAVDPKERFGTEYGAWALAENLVVDGDLVICAPGGPRGRIVALDRKSGATVWANTEIDESAAYCSPTIATHEGVRQLITLMDRSVVSVDVKTGRLLWRHEHKTPYDMNVTTPVVRDGRVLVSSGYGTGARLLEILPGGKGVRQAWLATDLDNCHTGVLLLDGLLYGSGCRQSEKGFACVDFRTGKTLWIDRDLWKVSVTFADGLLYALGHEGRLSLVEVGPKGCRVISAFDLPRKDKYDCLAHPVVCGGRLYIRQAETLTAYEVKAPVAR